MVETTKPTPPEKQEEPPDYYFTIKKDFHTKKQIDIWKVKIKRNYRITREHFTELKEVIKDFDGYYSHYSIYPNPAVTGTSGYKNMDYKRNKANRIERNAWEKYEYAKNKLNKTINLFLSRKIQNTPKTIDFTAEDLNQEIAKIRKQFKPELKTIKKAFGGTTKGRKRSSYYLDFEKGIFRLEINEFGNYVFHPYDDYRNLMNRRFNSVSEMMEQLKTDIKTIIEKLRKA
ncbi:MAG: hypothetical protein EU529_13145 [Promethearchaeota archaeon]|nr:MAG: hypothetical protein EU529_13145 [Candidatus Lokiarchaeota archaeon]